MVDGIKTVPTDEQKRIDKKHHDAWQALIPDPEAAYEEARNRPFKDSINTDKGVPRTKQEEWKYPIRKDGTRREGTYFRSVRRERDSPRFAKRFNAKEFAKKHNLPTDSYP